MGLRHRVDRAVALFRSDVGRKGAQYDWAKFAGSDRGAGDIRCTARGKRIQKH